MIGHLAKKHCLSSKSVLLGKFDSKLCLTWIKYIFWFRPFFAFFQLIIKITLIIALNFRTPSSTSLVSVPDSLDEDIEKGLPDDVTADVTKNEVDLATEIDNDVTKNAEISNETKEKEPEKKNENSDSEEEDSDDDWKQNDLAISQKNVNFQLKF